MTLYTVTFKTPWGPFSAAVDEDGAVVATAFGDQSALRARARLNEPATYIVDRARCAAVERQVLEYAARRRTVFALTLKPVGTSFQRRVWRALAEVPFGQTWSYARLASELESAPRAVGHANARNPICLLLPCHRVIGADGSLTGFAFGTDLKRKLLDHERAVLAAAA